MSFAKPPDNWWNARPVDLEEKIWMAIALLWCVVMFVVMVVWAVKAKQNPPSETYRSTPKEFQRRANEFAARHQAKDGQGKPEFMKGVPVVDAPEGEDSYLVARAWAWEPVLRLRKGRTYRVRLSSLDYQHGFSLQPVNLNLQVLPGYEYVATLTPTAAGEYLIVCNEYCGKDHHKMLGKMLVSE